MIYREQQKIINTLKSTIPKEKTLKGHRVEFGFKYKNGNRTNDLAIRIFVPKKKPKTALGDDLIPESIIGIKTDIIESNSRKECNEFLSRGYVNDLIGGVEIKNSLFNRNEGTLGCVVFKNNQPHVLTSHHVLFGRNHNGIGGAVTQPAIENEYIGVANDLPLYYSLTLDCAVFSIENRGYSIDNNLNGICGLIKDNKFPLLGDKVFKYGAATKLTQGIIEGIGTDDKFTVGKTNNSLNRLSAPGDSGALWVIKSGNHLRGVGLHIEGIDGKFALATSLIPIFKKLKLSHIFQTNINSIL